MIRVYAQRDGQPIPGEAVFTGSLDECQRTMAGLEAGTITLRDVRAPEFEAPPAPEPGYVYKMDANPQMEGAEAVSGPYTGSIFRISAASHWSLNFSRRSRRAAVAGRLNGLITTIDKHLAEICKERGIDLTAPERAWGMFDAGPP